MRRGLKLLAIGLACLGFAAAAWPWELASPAFRKVVTSRIEQATGSTATVAGPITLKLLPRPRLQMNDLGVRADRRRADARRPGGQGRVRHSRPSQRRVAPEFGDARRADRDAEPRPDGRGLSQGTFLARRLCRAVAHQPAPSWSLAAHVVEQCSGGSRRDRHRRDRHASGAGRSLRVFGDTATCAERRDNLSDGSSVRRRILDPEGSATSLQIDSPLFTFLATGLLSGGAQEQFSGHLAASTPALPHLLRALDGFPVALGTHRAQISGDLVARPHDLSLSDVQLKLDKGRFEGTLALRRDSGRDLVQGTLATDMLDVDALIGDAANRHDMAAYYRRPLDPSSFRTDIDMRVSALESRIGRLQLDETAFAALLRDGRLEISIDEARGYGGTLKARAIANVNRDGAEAQADVDAVACRPGQTVGGAQRAGAGQRRDHRNGGPRRERCKPARHRCDARRQRPGLDRKRPPRRSLPGADAAAPRPQAAARRAMARTADRVRQGGLEFRRRTGRSQHSRREVDGARPADELRQPDGPAGRQDRRSCRGGPNRCRRCAVAGRKSHAVRPVGILGPAHDADLRTRGHGLPSLSIPLFGADAPMP